MINLIGEENLPEQYTGMVKNIKYRSPCIQIYYRMSGLPEYEGRFAHINEGKKRNQVFIFPGVRGMEAGWDACKHGRIPDEQSITSIIMTMYDRSIAPEGEHCWVMFPYYFPMNAPRDQWSGIAEQMADKCLETYTRYAPNIPNIVLDRKIMTAADYERIYNATNGDFVHGSMAIDQMLDMRPVPGWSNYSTPVDNFYLCGAANHPGMGVTSLPGYIAAKTILKNWSKTGSKKSVTSEGLN
jgi:phytoene dehydrogenase-like protein